MNYPAYPEYKDSGVQWVNNLPNGWRSAPVWTLFRRTKALGFPDHELLSVYRDHGVVPKSSRDDNFNKPSDDLSAYQLVKRGFLVVNKMKAWQGSISVSGHEGIVSPAYYVYAPTCDQNLRYMHFALRSSPMIASYASISSGVRPNQWDLDPQTFSRLQVPLPPLAEQSAIADFLDRETAKIDALIAKQEQLIATLREDRIATITHAVTKGLDPNAEMKDSGVEWLGEIPAHWACPQIGMLSSVGNGSTPARENPAYWSNGSIPWLNSSHVNRDEITEADQFVSELAVKECHLPMVEPGSVLVGLTGQGKTRGMSSLLLFRCTINQHLAYVTPRYDAVSAPYLRRVLDSAYDTLRDISDENGSTKGGLTCTAIRKLRIPLPPLHEQREITSYVSQRTAKLDALIAKSERMIGVLREYRSALITDAVTGKIDVRGAA